MPTQIVDCVDALAERIDDGAKIAIFKDNAVPMALGRALVQRRTQGLHMVCVPTGGLLPDILIGAGCVATVETAGISLGEFGLAPRFTAAVKAGTIAVLDATCPAIYAGLQASEKGIPFMPLRGIIGSDILENRRDFAVIDNPFAPNDPIVALPAIQPDVALFHAPLADVHGNVYIGRSGELKIMAHAAKATYVTAERVVEFNLLENDAYACACLNALYVDAIALAPGGARPLSLAGHYEVESNALGTYASLAKTEAGFAEWLETHFAQGSRVAA